MTRISRICLLGAVLLFISILFSALRPETAFSRKENDKSIQLIDEREDRKQTSIDTVKVDDFSYIRIKDICLFYRIGFTYDPASKGVTLKKDNKSVTIQPDTTELNIGNKKITLSRPPVIVNWKMVVPPKAMASILEELLGCPVTWRSSTNVFYVNDKQGVSFWEDQPETFLKTVDPKNAELKTGDMLTISVWQQGSYELDELTRDRQVEDDGTIKFPFVGDVSAVGLTPSQLEGRLAGKLKAYIKDPEVTVRVKNKTTYKVQIFGAVRNPGIYEFSELATLMEAVNRAGGFNSKANLANVRVTRAIHHSPYQTDIVNAKLILYEGQRQYDVPVSDKDIIFVPEKKGFFSSTFSSEVVKHALFTSVTILVGIMMRE
ncbi:MAG: polysaccharide biosynthesis/export family protein [Elusimicrobiota bacterium]